MEKTSFKPGQFCWTELAVPDTTSAREFYTRLMGWEYEESPVGEGMVYTMFRVGGKSVGAMYQETDPHIPPHWNLYICVESADDTAARAKELGGGVIAPPFDVMTFGRMAVLSDPQGAAFCVWQPKVHHGFERVDEVGAQCWTEVYTRDVPASAAFYTGLFGWGTQGDPKEYTEFTMEGKSFAGMKEITPEMGPDVPPHWLAYYQVADCDQATATAREMGARILAGPMDVHGMRFTIFMDPQGAVLAVIKLPS